MSTKGFILWMFVSLSFGEQLDWLAAIRNSEVLKPFDPYEKFVSSNGVCMTPLKAAVMFRHFAAIRWLLVNGVDPNKPFPCPTQPTLLSWLDLTHCVTPDGLNSPLGLAIAIEKFAAVGMTKLLLEFGAKSDLNSCKVHVGLCAKKVLLIAMCILLLNPLTIMGVCGKSLWFLLVAKYMVGGAIMCFMLFVAVTLVIFRGRSWAFSPSCLPLAFAITHDDASLVKLLLDFNASAVTRLSGPSTLLALSIKKGNIDIVASLLQNGANVEQHSDSLLHIDVSDGFNVCAAFTCVVLISYFKRRNQYRMANLIICYSIVILCSLMFLDSKTFPFTKSPLALAVGSKDLRMVELLRKFGADMQKNILYFWTPSKYAVWKNAPEIAENLRDWKKQ
jgi:hypothetical protein